ncbi:ATP-dependent helicase HrpB [Paenibacillus sp. Marseille-P2973]|uniref:ATP-dependent helicase HrpB n=1 Tax=Paenibacillus sp. Marseille-P2973 TaxID=1871032 RepID=UPI001B361C98|nr:ATP-dependent helicase HrpB [Paenibacillus sp. Marseille-P2973]MBQ4899064.1 ATP-dependent helicase HrpB [Paenibacillus sp. Marseille-P2973]
MNRLLMPIDEVIPSLRENLNSAGAAVLIAEPGAGKTTRTPLELLNEPWMEGQQMILLEPRRLAARSAALYMAGQLGERVGETVGYRIRTESKVSSRTKITVVTEGILTRMLQNDPALIGTGLLIFDEFHERSLHADLGLALALQSRQLLREDLRILVMSATLDASPVAELLGNAPVVQSRGRMYPVETVFAGRPQGETLEAAVARTVHRALAEHEGSVLVFLPGAREIRRVESALAGQVPAGVTVAPLYGALPQEQQQRAIGAAPDGGRKVVLATSIAETSLTVSGVTVVIDSGLRRTALFSPRTGMSRLVTVRAARDAADQRRGRAGRTAPGTCYRLWTEAEDRALAPSTPPEMLEADLTPLALELAAWGAESPAELAWLDAPPAAPYGQAVQLLRQLGALDAAGRITGHGRRMAALGLHPRLAHMLLRARPLGLGRAACRMAALLEEPGLIKGPAAGSDGDLRSRLAILMAAGGDSGIIHHAAHATHNDGHTAGSADIQRLLTVSRQWENRLEAQLPDSVVTDAAGDWWNMCGLLISFAYPDRIARRRGDGRYLLRSGRGAAFARQQPLSAEDFLAIAEVDDEGPEGRILLAAPMQESWLTEYYGDELKEEKTAEWNEEIGAVRARIILSLGAIVLKDQPDPKPSPELVLQALLRIVAEQGPTILPWNAKSRQLQARILFLRQMNEERWPDVSDEALSKEAAEWFAPYVAGFRKKSDLQILSLHQILENRLGWQLVQELNEEAPTHLLVPSGSKIPVQYDGPQAPYASVRLQEVFGMMETPRIGYGRIPITLHLLSPASRPVQVTADLTSFWNNTYFEVKKDLKGRYPKHYWPDDPLEATATRRVRPGNGK